MGSVRHRSSIVVLVAALLVGALALAACGSDDSSDTKSGSSTTTAKSSSGGSGSGKLPSCPSASEVDGVLDAGLQSPRATTTGKVRTCTYDTTAGGDQVVIRYQVDVSPAEFQTSSTATGPSGEPTTPVAGIGDSAFSMRREEPGSTVTEVVALSGTTVVAVVAPVDLQRTEDLTKKLVDQL